MIKLLFFSKIGPKIRTTFVHRLRWEQLTDLRGDYFKINDDKIAYIIISSTLYTPQVMR